MRRLKKRPKFSALPEETRRKLNSITEEIRSAPDPKARAKSAYESARSAQWFQPVIDALRDIAGPGERCMLCSGSESSDVEHYRPKDRFHEDALNWANYLWVCTTCNRFKGNRFPPDTEPVGRLINPLDENVWDYFFIDQYGNLTPKMDLERDDYDERALSTFTILRLDREALQETRQARLCDLVEKVTDALRQLQASTLDASEIKKRLKKWRFQPFQSDVADYFLNGPGMNDEPFRSLFAALRDAANLDS